MHPRRPARTSGVEKSNFNPLAVRRYNSARPTGAHTSVVRTDQAAAVVDTLPTEAKMLVRGEEGIPASHYQTAYELAFQNTSRSFSGEGVSWSPLIETLIRGESMRQSMQAPCSLSAVDADSALLCLRHLWDVQLGLSLTSGRPRKRDELIFIQTVKAELKALQLILKNREISFSIDEKPSLQLALTHLLLGAVSLNLIKLHEKFPENIRAELTPPTDFSNPLHHAHTTASRDQSVLVKLSQAAYDYLEHNGATLSWIRKLQSSDWINEVLQNLGDPSDREDSSSLLELLIRHTETLRKTHQEPIEISLLTVGIYLTVGAGIVLFMKYQVPNPFTAENIRASDGTLDFFAPLQASATEAATMLPNPNATSTQTLTPSQMQTLSQRLSQSLTQTLNQLFSASQSTSASFSGTLSQTLTRSQIQTLSQFLTSSQSASPTPAPLSCNATIENFWVETLGGTGRDEGYRLAITPDGGVLLAGYTNSFGAGGYDVLLAKFYSNGSLAWAQTLGGINDDYCEGLLVAPDGSLVLSGWTSNFGGGALIAKFQSDGTLVWAQVLGEPGGSTGCNDLVMPPDSSLVLGAYTTSVGAGTYDVLLAKLYPNGTVAWAQTLGGAGNDWPNKLALDSDGDLVMLGDTTSFGAGAYDVLVAKFHANGSLIFAQTLGGFSNDQAYGLAVTSYSSRWYLTGYTDSFGAGSADVFIAVVQSNGSLAWFQSFGGINAEEANSLVIASNGNLLLTGYTNSFGAGDDDLLIAEFQPNGSLVFAQTLGGNAADSGSDLMMTPNGTVLITGHSASFSFAMGASNVLLAQLNAEGELPFINALTQRITTAQTQFINPTIINITNLLNISFWNMPARNWTSVIVSRINPSLKNINCVSASVTSSATTSASMSQSSSASQSQSPTPSPYPQIVDSSIRMNRNFITLISFNTNQANAPIAQCTFSFPAANASALEIITVNTVMWTPGMVGQLSYTTILPSGSASLTQIAGTEFLARALNSVIGIVPLCLTCNFTSPLIPPTTGFVYVYLNQAVPSRRRLQLSDVKKEQLHRRNAEHYTKPSSRNRRLKSEYGSSSTSPIVRPTPSSRYDALDKSASNTSTENSFATLESALGIGALLCLMTLLMLYFSRRIKPAVVSQGNANFFFGRDRSLKAESRAIQDHAAHFSSAK